LTLRISETSTTGKRKALHSELFTKDLFEEKDLPQEHNLAKTHCQVKNMKYLIKEI
jgi:hypothetical protein